MGHEVKQENSELSYSRVVTYVMGRFGAVHNARTVIW